jgi:ribosomal protein S18 acetylase RimI-like enzyme
MAVLVRARRPDDVLLLAPIEQAAGLLFLEVGMPEIAGDDPLPEDMLLQGVDAELLWVAVDEGESLAPVAYLLAKNLDESHHIEQLTVHPRYARQRIGSRLIDACGEGAIACGSGSLTLTTFRDVPWNAPYYRRIAFVEMPDSQMSPALREIVQQEHDAGLDRWPRVVMGRMLTR